MRDRGLIYTGLATFLVLATFPAWYNLSGRVTAQGPKLAPPVRAKQCVAALDYMRTSHMALLVGWRDEVVRRGGREFTGHDGTRYKMSLTSTCLGQCHGGKEEFCDRCHLYAAVAPSCWNCHLDSQSGQRAALERRDGCRNGGDR